jgi:hypothetical protein
MMAAVGLLTACSSDGTRPERDAGAMRRDATVVDGGDTLDAAQALESGTDAGDGGGVDARADAAATCEPKPCNPTDGSLCSSGKTCALFEGAPLCVSSVERREAGASCERSAECAPGLSCFREGEGDNTGVCGQVCCPADGSGCGSEQRCEGQAVLLDGSETQWGRCVEVGCDILNPVESCGSGEACYIASSTGDTECMPVGSVEEGEPCQRQRDCAPGLSCAGLHSPTCKRVCSLNPGREPQCRAGEGNCVAYAQSPEGTGLCTEATSGGS